MQPQNNNVYRFDIIYPGVGKPELVAAVGVDSYALSAYTSYKAIKQAAPTLPTGQALSRHSGISCLSGSPNSNWRL